MLLAHLTDIRNLQNEVVRRCNKMGLDVRFDEEAYTAYTNEKEVVFPALVPPITVDQLLLLVCQAVHEPGHQIRGKAIELLKEARIPSGNPLGALWNVVEDECMERQIQRAWRGDRKALVEGHRVLASKMADSWGANKNKKAGENTEKAVSAYLVAMESRKDWDYMADANAMLMRANVPQSVCDLADELIAEGWAERIANGGDEEGAKQVAYDLFERLYPGEKAKDQEIPEGQSGAGGEEEDEGEEGAAGKTSKYEDGDGSEDGNSAGHFIVKWDDIIQSEHGQKGNLGSSSHITWDGHGYNPNNVQFIPPNDIRVHDYSRNKDTHGKHHYGEGGLADKQFANQVRRLIQSEQRVKNDYELKSGKLDKRNMIRVLLPSREGGDWNRRVFYDTDDTRTLNTAILILVDWSGSMSGNKMKIACNATQRLVDTFDRALRVPCEVNAFSGGWGDMDYGIIKSFAEKAVTSDDIGRRFSTFGMHTSGNPDGDALMEANAKLHKRNEARKIMIVLSDGSPAGGVGESGAVLMAAIEEVRRSGTEVYGIGIECTSVKHFYGADCQVINHANELNNALLKTLEKMVRHGH